MTVEEPTGRLRRSRVASTRWVTPGMVRVTLAGDLEDFVDQGGDQHVALYFYPDEALLPEVLDPEVLDRLHRYAHPRTRRYTIRRFDPERRTVDMDFVVHQPAGLAAAWAQEAAVGDEVIWWGPTRAWAPDPATGNLLLVGDETALPAIDAMLAGSGVAGPGEHVAVTVVAHIDDERDEAYLAHHEDRARIHWVHRRQPRGREDAGVLAAVAEHMSHPLERLQVWVAAEFATTGALRRWLHGDCGLDRHAAYCVTYWTHGRAQDARAEARWLRAQAANRAADPQEALRYVRHL